MPKYSYKEAFYMSPKLGHRIVQVMRISDAVAVLLILGEGKLMASTRRRPESGGYYNMASIEANELVGKTEEQIYEMLDKRTDKVIELERQRRAV